MEWEAGGNDCAVNGQIWGVNVRGKAVGWGVFSTALDSVDTSLGHGSIGLVLSLALSELKGYPKGRAGFR